jgi:mRNA interferase MazF
MSKWDVVLIQYPFTDLTVLKLRPAVVISPDDFNAGPDVVVAAITTNTASLSQYDLLIAANHAEFRATGLQAPSAARMTKIFTLHQNLINRTIGAFGPQLQAEAKNKIQAFFGL